MKQIVFYSWQSDLPNACNRGLIELALENAATAITADDTVEIEPVVVRDTQGVPGAPDIASTIFSRIAAADVFVADVSITGRGGKRATPNPNVLIELGYALKALGDERVVLVFNRAFGKIEELPFDLKMRRVLAYDMPQDQTQKAPERSSLGKQLDAAIRAALGTPREAKGSPIPAVPAIEGQQANRTIIIRRNLADLLNKLIKLQPKKLRDGGTVDDLIAALNLTQEAVAEFSKIAEMVSLMNDTDAALELHRWFGQIFQEYDLPENFSGRYSTADQDYFKFLGHELFVTFIGFLLREQRWAILERVLAEPIPMRYLRSDHGPGTADWKFASEHLDSLLTESPRRQRVSLHADMLNERHTSGGLATVVPLNAFVAADYFLFLLAEFQRDATANSFFDWRPWSTLYMKQVPLFLRNAEHRSYANHLMHLFQVKSADDFRKRLTEYAPRLGSLFSHALWRSPIGTKDIERFASR